MKLAMTVVYTHEAKSDRLLEHVNQKQEIGYSTVAVGRTRKPPTVLNAASILVEHTKFLVMCAIELFRLAKPSSTKF